MATPGTTSSVLLDNGAASPRLPLAVRPSTWPGPNAESSRPWPPRSGSAEKVGQSDQALTEPPIG